MSIKLFAVSIYHIKIFVYLYFYFVFNSFTKLLYLCTTYFAQHFLGFLFAYQKSKTKENRKKNHKNWRKQQRHILNQFQLLFFFFFWSKPWGHFCHFTHNNILCHGKNHWHDSSIRKKIDTKLTCSGLT